MSLDDGASDGDKMAPHYGDMHRVFLVFVSVFMLYVFVFCTVCRAQVFDHQTLLDLRPNVPSEWKPRDLPRELLINNNNAGASPWNSNRQRRGKWGTVLARPTSPLTPVCCWPTSSLWMRINSTISIAVCAPNGISGQTVPGQTQASLKEVVSASSSMTIGALTWLLCHSTVCQYWTTSQYGADLSTFPENIPVYC